MRNGAPFSKPRVRLYGEPGDAQTYLGAAYNLLYKVRQYCETTGAPVFAMQRTLENGAVVQAAVFGNEESVSCYPPAFVTGAEVERPKKEPESKKLQFAFEPSEVYEEPAPFGQVNVRRRFFGKPFLNAGGNEINWPLGTAFGSSPVWLLKLLDKKPKTKRGQSRNYGMRNWTDGKRYISWRGPSSRVFNELSFLISNLSTTGYESSTGAHGFSRTWLVASLASWWKTSPSSRAFILEWQADVFRDRQVYEAGVVLFSADTYFLAGDVCGAGYFEGRLIVFMVERMLSPIFRAYEIVGGEAALLHEAQVVGGVCQSDWYMSATSGKACITLERRAGAFASLIDFFYLVPTSIVFGHFDYETGFSFEDVAVWADLNSTTRSFNTVYESVPQQPWIEGVQPYIEAHGSYTNDFQVAATSRDVPLTCDYKDDEFVDLVYKTRAYTNSHIITYTATPVPALDGNPNRRDIAWEYSNTNVIEEQSAGRYVTSDGAIDLVALSSTRALEATASRIHDEYTNDINASRSDSSLYSDLRIDFINLRDDLFVLHRRTFSNSVSGGGRAAPSGDYRWVTPASGHNNSSDETVVWRSSGERSFLDPVTEAQAVTVVYHSYNPFPQPEPGPVDPVVLARQQVVFIQATLNALSPVSFSGAVLDDVVFISLSDRDGHRGAYLSGVANPKGTLLKRESAAFSIHNIGIV